MAVARQNGRGRRLEGRGAPVQRIRLDDNRFANRLLLVWLMCIVGVAAWLLFIGGQHGGLEAAVAHTPSADYNWIFWAIMAVAVPTVLLVVILPASYRTVVLSSKGIALEQFGRTVWLLVWTDFAGWFWYRDGRGEPVALRLADRAGGYREIRGWNSDRLPVVFGVLDALDHWAPGQGELPSVTLATHELTSTELKGALVIGLVVLVGFGGIVLMALLWQ
jgi:hypothetical protein